MLLGELRSHRSSEVGHRHPGERLGDQLALALREPRIDQCVAENVRAIERDAVIAGVDVRTFERQVRLHLPSVRATALADGKYGDAYDAVRPMALVRAACIRQESERAEVRANASLLISRNFSVKKDLKLEAADGSSLNLRFGLVRPSIGHIYQSYLHYLRSPRGDTSFHFGIFLPGASYPLTYVAVSVCDRPYMVDSLLASGLQCHREDCLVITRMHGLPGMPANLMSVTLRQAVKALRKLSHAKLLLTAYNPMLGFTGASFRASGFHPFAIAPVSYHYSERGEFTARRTTVAPELEEIDNLPNVLLVRGIDKFFQREIIDHVQLNNISTSDYEKNVSAHGQLPNVDARVWLKQLRSYRSVLEGAWSLKTIHPSYLVNSRGVSSRGQCGVSSVWLTQELRRNYGVDSTYCYGDLLFSDKGIAPVSHHCWVEIGDQDDPSRLVIDLTCDQADSIEEPVLCAQYKDLVGQGLVYEARTRLALDRLPEDRVWGRFMVLSDAVTLPLEDSLLVD